MNTRFFYSLSSPSFYLLVSNQISEADRSVQQAEDIAMTLDSDYQALSSKEETDIEALIADSENAISDAEAFAQQLAKDLSVLDGVTT